MYPPMSDQPVPSDLDHLACYDRVGKLAESYYRSRALGVHPDLDRPRLAGIPLGDGRDDPELERLARLGRSYLRELHQDLAEPSYLLLLTDPAGNLLDVVSDAVTLERCTAIGIVPGANLSEASCGTTAPALALLYEESLVVRREEHYCGIFHEWTCCACPLFGPQGRLVGCLAVASRDEYRSGELVALARSSAWTLERKLSLASPVPAGVEEAPTEAPGQAPLLTPRQQELLRLWVRGYTYKEVAEAMGISAETVKTHLKQIYVRLGTRRKSECVKAALRLGLL